MADKEFKDFPATLFADLVGTDLFAAQTDLSGARTNKKLTVTELNTGMQALVNATSLTSLAGTLSIAKGGTGNITAAAAFAALAPLTTKGDLLGFTTTTTRLAVGTDGYVLKADSSAASGLAWGQLGFSDLTGTLAIASTTGTLAIARGGTANTTANAAFNALSPQTTKGDLISFSTVAARLAVGTNGQVLTAQSGQTTGLLWATLGFSDLAGTVSLTTQASGTLQAAQFPALTGDVTTSAASLATTIATDAVTAAKILADAVTTVKILNNNVTLAKLATMATDSILGRATAATGNVEVLTALPWAFTGDVTSSADSNALSIASNAVVTAKINDAAVTLAKMANIATASVIGRNTAGSGVPEVLTTLPNGVQDNITRLGTIASGVWTGTTIAIANGGTGNTSAAAAFAALAPLTTKGDILTYTTTTARLAVGTDAQVLVADSTQSAGIKWATNTAAPAGSDTQVQFNDGGATGAASSLTFAKTTPLLTLTYAPAANTAPSGGLLLQDTTAATSGNQQESPFLKFSGKGWGTTAGTSQDVSFQFYVLPVQGTVPSGTLTINSSINGGAFGSAMTFTSGGALTVTGAMTGNSWTGNGSGSTVVAGSTGYLALSGKSRIYSSADGLIELQNNANNNFTRLNFGGTSSSFPALKRSSAKLAVRLADDSADADITAANLIGSNRLYLDSGAADMSMFRSAAGDWLASDEGGTVAGAIRTGLNITAKTANYTVLTADLGRCFNNTGASGDFTFTLKASPLKGDNYWFEVTTDTKKITVAGNTGQTIRYGGTVSASAGTIFSSAIGSVIYVVYSGAQWVIYYLSGTWTGPA